MKKLFHILNRLAIFRATVFCQRKSEPKKHHTKTEKKKKKIIANERQNRWDGKRESSKHQEKIKPTNQRHVLLCFLPSLLLLVGRVFGNCHYSIALLISYLKPLLWYLQGEKASPGYSSFAALLVLFLSGWSRASKKKNKIKLQKKKYERNDIFYLSIPGERRAFSRRGYLFSI